MINATNTILVNGGTGKTGNVGICTRRVHKVYLTYYPDLTVPGSDIALTTRRPRKSVSLVTGRQQPSRALAGSTHATS